MPQLLNAFTVDVEDYYQVSAFEQDIRRADWDRYESRVVKNTHRLLDLLEAYQAKATFYVLGWVAERHPQLVREIYDSGHEVGSHSYWHRRVYQQTPQEFRRDLRRARDVLEAILGVRVVAYRAPSFSITRRSLWALEILVEEGCRVDSSIFPIYHDRYGIPGARPDLHRLVTPAGALWEFPPSVLKFGRMALPVAGGGYFRLLPLSLSLYCLGRLNRVARQPFMFYIHPWEVDPEQPRLQAGSFLSRRRHYLHLGQTERKLAALLERFSVGRVADVVASVGSPAETLCPTAAAVL